MPRFPALLVVLTAAAGVPAQEESSPQALLRAAMELYEEERFADALPLLEKALAASPDDVKLLTMGAWCQLRLAASEPQRVHQADAWFAKIAQGRTQGQPAQVVLGIGQCQQLLALAAATEAERRRHLDAADRAFTDLVERQEQLQHALRHRTEVRLALGATEAALADARDFEQHMTEQCARIEREATATAIQEYRRELDLRLAHRRAELGSLQARVALHQWRAGDHAAARQRVESLLSAAEPPFEEPAVAELLWRVAPSDPRVAPAHVFRMQHAARDTERCEAAIALGQLGAASGVVLPALTRAARGSDLAVARAAVTALGMMGPGAEEAIALVEGLLDHQDAELAARAAAALRSIRGQDPVR